MRASLRLALLLAAAAPRAQALPPGLSCAGSDALARGADPRCREILAEIGRLPRDRRPALRPGSVAAKQRDVFENKIRATAYSSLPDLDTGLLLGVERGGAPVETLAPDARGLKAMNTFGSAALFELVPEPGSPFTGLFRGGAGVMRFSYAGPPRLVGNVPGLGLKFFVDGGEERDLVLMNGLSAQGDATSVFRRPLSNQLAAPEGALMRAVVAALSKLSPRGDPLRSEVSHLASIGADGEPAAGARAPHQLLLLPTGQDGIPAGSTADFRADLAKVRPGTAVYDVLARERPDGPVIRVGRIVTRSPFVASEYGDRALAFKHR